VVGRRALFHVEAFAPFRVWGLDRVEEAAADLLICPQLPAILKPKGMGSDLHESLQTLLSLVFSVARITANLL